MKRIGISIVSLLLCACSLAKVPEDQEWMRILQMRSQIEQTRSSAPPSIASRLQLIEYHLWLEEAIGEVYPRYIEELEDYYQTRGTAESAALLAREKVISGDSYAEVLGRHDRAMEFYLAALDLVPNDPVVAEKLERSNSRIYIEQSSFARVRIGMRESDVEEILGYPRVSWVRQTVRRGRVFTAWIYPRKGGGAAAVYLDNGIVYHKNWVAGK